MKRIIFYLFFLTVAHNTFAQTQLEMNIAEHEKFVAADKELNKVYQKILKEYKTDVIFIKNLKASQRLWIQFREAELKMRYPEREAGYYGSMHPMCWSMYKTELTQERIEKLKLWLSGKEDPYACTSSIKTD